MKELNKLQSLLFQVGGILLVAGAILPMVSELRDYAVLVFSIGVLLFGSMQLLQRYEGRSIVLRRLRRQQIIGIALLAASAALMLMKEYHVGPIAIRGDEWKVTLIVAAILELYTSFRIPAELEKEQ